MKTIDLRSDTITLPTEEMRRAMYDAKVGDDVFGEDPTVNELERLATRITGKEAAIFTPSGTMSNVIAVICYTELGDEIILGSEAHMLWYELGGASALGNVVMRTVPNNPDGTISIDGIQKVVRPGDFHSPRTSLLCLENTHNRCGGTVLEPGYVKNVSDFAHSHGLYVHLDGARIFNATTALNTPVEELCEPIDSICFCLSKGLSAPVGSLLCGTCSFIKKARTIRKMLGGGMRQSGVLAAAGIVALNNVARLAEDNQNAKELAAGLVSIGIDTNNARTNILLFKPPFNLSTERFIEQMDSIGVRFLPLDQSTVRAVTNRMISSDDIDDVLLRIRRWVEKQGA